MAVPASPQQFPPDQSSSFAAFIDQTNDDSAAPREREEVGRPSGRVGDNGPPSVNETGGRTSYCDGRGDGDEGRVEGADSLGRRQGEETAAASFRYPTSTLLRSADVRRRTLQSTIAAAANGRPEAAILAVPWHARASISSDRRLSSVGCWHGVDLQYALQKIEFALRVAIVAMLPLSFLVYLDYRGTLPVLLGIVSRASVLNMATIVINPTLGQTLANAGEVLLSMLFALPLGLILTVAGLYQNVVAWVIVTFFALILLGLLSEGLTRKMSLVFFIGAMTAHFDAASAERLAMNRSAWYAVHQLQDVCLGMAFGIAGALLPFPRTAYAEARELTSVANRALRIAIQGGGSGLWADNSRRRFHLLKVRGERKTAERALASARMALNWAKHEAFEHESLQAMTKHLKLYEAILDFVFHMESTLETLVQSPDILQSSTRGERFRRYLNEPLAVSVASMDAVLLAVDLTLDGDADNERGVSAGGGSAQSAESMLAISIEVFHSARAHLSEVIDIARNKIYYGYRISDDSDRVEPDEDPPPHEEADAAGNAAVWADGATVPRRDGASALPMADQRRHTDVVVAPAVAATMLQETSSSLGSSLPRLDEASPSVPLPNAQADDHAPVTSAPGSDRRRQTVVIATAPYAPRSYIADKCSVLIHAYFFNITQMQDAISVALSDDAVRCPQYQRKSGRGSVGWVLARVIQHQASLALASLRFTTHELYALVVKREPESLRRLLENVKTALAMMLTLAIVYFTTQGQTKATGPTIVAFCSAADTGQALHGSVLRLIGTLIGGVLGFFLSSVASTETDRIAFMIALLFVANFFRTGKTYGVAAFYSCFVFIPLLAPGAKENGIDRLQHNCLGVIVYFIVQTLLWPVRPTMLLLQHRERQLCQIKSIIVDLLSFPLDIIMMREEGGLNDGCREEAQRSSPPPQDRAPGGGPRIAFLASPRITAEGIKGRLDALAASMKLERELIEVAALQPTLYRGSVPEQAHTKVFECQRLLARTMRSLWLSVTSLGRCLDRCAEKMCPQQHGVTLLLSLTSLASDERAREPFASMENLPRQSDPRLVPISSPTTGVDAGGGGSMPQDYELYRMLRSTAKHRCDVAADVALLLDLVITLCQSGGQPHSSMMEHLGDAVSRVVGTSREFHAARNRLLADVVPRYWGKRSPITNTGAEAHAALSGCTIELSYRLRDLVIAVEMLAVEENLIVL